jgi:hypothetical protein
MKRDPKKHPNRYSPYSRYQSATVDLTLRVLDTHRLIYAKPILSLFRYGRLPKDFRSPLGQRVSPFLRQLLADHTNITPESDISLSRLRRKFTDHLLEDLEDPVVRGIIVQAAEMVRLTEEEEDKIRTDALWKEVSVFRRVVTERPQISWAAVFEGGDVTLTHESTGFGISDIQYTLGRIHSRLSQTVLYPSMSRKLIPIRAMRWLQERPQLVREDLEAITTATLERVYITSGTFLDGPSELKQRWYMSGQVPRTYAVAGETAYFRSRYLKDLWNIIWNSLEGTDKFKRVDVTRLRRRSMEYSFAFYDLTTFTSNFETHRDFVKALAKQFSTTMVTIADGREGFYDESVETLLNDYANHCCQNVKWYTELGGLDDIAEDFHAVAGLLGIIGNIASCGVAHGFFLRTLVDLKEEYGVAGDDAVFVYLIAKGWKDHVRELKYLGILAEEKVYDLEDKDAMYLKRGVDTDGYSLSLREFVIFPRLSYLSPHDLERFRESQEMKYDPHYLKRSFISSLGSTFSSAARCKVTIESHPQLHQLLKQCYDELGLPHQGYVPGSTPIDIPVYAEDRFVPNLELLGDSDYVRKQFMADFQGMDQVFERELPRTAVYLDVRCHDTIIARSSKEARYLERIGVLERSKRLRSSVGFRRLKDLEDATAARRPGLVYTYKVVDTSLFEFLHEDICYIPGCLDV